MFEYNNSILANITKINLDTNEEIFIAQYYLMAPYGKHTSFGEGRRDQQVIPLNFNDAFGRTGFNTEDNFEPSTGLFKYQVQFSYSYYGTSDTGLCQFSSSVSSYSQIKASIREVEKEVI